jgi:hypothetical protein
MQMPVHAYRKSAFRVLLLVVVLLNTVPASGNGINAAMEYPLHKAVDNIAVDGTLDEESWALAFVADGFHQVLPMDTSKAWSGTEVLMTFDDHNLYLAAICHDSLPGGYVVESMRRDFVFGRNDNFLVFIDPFLDRTNGFSFGANAAGAQWDGLMYNGGRVDLSWDNRWQSAVQQYEKYWIFECAIPFKTIRYKEGLQRWGINFSRLDLKLNEKSSWAPVPRQFPTASLAFTGTLVWQEPPPSPGTNISVIPYATTGAFADFGEMPLEELRADFGGDAKIGITPSLNLDLTFNPDFSQVEVDRQVTNLSRFELFFPERRQFFIENSDLFANLGDEDIRPFFSRRIGLNAPIYFGARMSGRVDEKWRLGAMDIHTGAQDQQGIPGQNYAVAVLQRQVFSRSNITASFINRETVQYQPEGRDSLYSKSNRNLGVEYNLASANNLWTGKFFVHKSWTTGDGGDGITHAADLEYESRTWRFTWHHEFVGDGYNAEVGFVPRGAYWSVNPRAGYRFFSDSRILVSHGPYVGTNNYWTLGNMLNESESFLRYSFFFLDRSEAGAWVSNDYIRLLQPFDPTNTDGDTLATGTEYQWNAWGFFYASTQARRFTYELQTRFGGYYGGYRSNVSGGLAYRFQPYGSVSVDFSYNDIDMPQPYKSADFWLLGPRIDITFTNSIFLSTFLQYNQQSDNINLNARFQWRYKPASDIYLVYTDNYLPAGLSVKNRALVFKITYWYNI